jgi:uncharacterized membrane protein
MDGFAILIALAAFVLALIAMNKLSRLDVKLAQLKLQLGNLTDELARLRTATPAAEEPPIVTKEAVEPEPKARPAVALPAGMAKFEESLSLEPERAPEPDKAPQPEKADTPFSRAASDAAAQMPPPVAPKTLVSDMEQKLASRWFVWIGGLAIAISGLLFVKYAYDNGLISPTLQVILGLLLAAGLVVAGLWLKPKSEPGSYVPAAVSAGGLATAFGTTYAAYALYELIHPSTAFLGLGVVALIAFGLSRSLGPLIAALGILGGYGAPTLIPSGNPSAWTFFPYLLVIFAAAIYTLRGRIWWWLGYAAIAGAAAWGFLWINSGPFKFGDVLPIGLFAHAIGAIAFYGLAGRGILEEHSGDLRDPKSVSQALWIGLAGLAAEVALLMLLVQASEHGTLALILFFLAAAGAIALAWLKYGLSPLAPVAGTLGFLALMNWREAAFHEWVMDEQGLWSSIMGGAAPEFLRWMLIAGAAFLIVGLVGVLKKESRSFAILAAGSAALFPFGAWARVDQLLSNSSWAAIAVAGAAAVFALIFKTDSRRNDVVSGLLSIGAAIALLFAADRLFYGVWLAIAMGLLALAYSLATKKLAATWLAPISAALGWLTAARLFVMREIWGEPSNLPWGEHWPLYGYGLPVLLLYGASRILNGDHQRRWKITLEGLSLGLAIALVSLELRALISGEPGEEPGLLEMSAHSLAWLGAAYGLMYRQQAFSSFVAMWGARVLIAVSCGMIILGSLLGLNPVVTEEPVPGSAVFNALLLAYLAPVPLLGLIARRLPLIGWAPARNPIGLLALVLGFAYVTLQTKLMFQGSVLVAWTETVPEDYAYSAVWLAFGIAVFLVGLVLQRQPIRYAGLGVVSLVVLKVFLWDMAGLEGLYRIASFMGLGLCLVGIGWLYGKFVMQKKGLEEKNSPLENNPLQR